LNTVAEFQYKNVHLGNPVTASLHILFNFLVSPLLYIVAVAFELSSARSYQPTLPSGKGK
jgi:hypothetical protein